MYNLVAAAMTARGEGLVCGTGGALTYGRPLDRQTDDGGGVSGGSTSLRPTCPSSTTSGIPYVRPHNLSVVPVTSANRNVATVSSPTNLVDLPPIGSWVYILHGSTWLFARVNKRLEGGFAELVSPADSSNMMGYPTNRQNRVFHVQFPCSSHRVRTESPFAPIATAPQLQIRYGSTGLDDHRISAARANGNDDMRFLSGLPPMPAYGRGMRPSDSPGSSEDSAVKRGAYPHTEARKVSDPPSSSWRF